MGLSPGSNGRVRPVLFVSGCRHAARAGFFGALSMSLPHGGCLTVQPYHRTGSWQEGFSAFFNAAVLGGSGRFAAWAREDQGGAFGPCLFCRSEDYLSAGGHESIRAEVLDHDRLAARFRLAGMPSVTRLGGGLLAFRMYSGGWREISMGWAKSIALGAGGSARLMLLLTVLWISGLAGAAIGMIQALADLPLEGSQGRDLTDRTGIALPAGRLELPQSFPSRRLVRLGGGSCFIPLSCSISAEYSAMRCIAPM